MKQKKWISLITALVMTVSLCAVVVVTGQSSASAESVPGAAPSRVLTAETALPRADETDDETEQAAPLMPASVAAERTEAPSPLGALTGALNADQVKKARDEAQAEEAKKAEEDKQNALPASDTSVVYVGTVDSSDVRIRTAPVSGEIVNTLGYGTAVSILDEQDGWYRVNYDGQNGYMSAEYVTARTEAYDLSGYGRVEADILYLRAQPSSDSSAICMVSDGEYVSLSGFSNGWYAVSYDGYDGYMSGDYLTPVASKPAPATSVSAPATSSYEPEPSAPAEPEPTPDPAPAPASGSGSAIADYAKQFLGTAYVYGGASPYGFDCSGFTMYVFSQFGYSLPHGASGQMSCGYAVSQSELQPGDLVFFYDPSYAYGGVSATHVGIYVGNRQFIHASSYNGGVCYSSLDDPWYYSPLYCGARRIG